ncbi:DNA-binding transcriptional response regulator [Commensalibacter papalotli (ex Servin-Garciduenas et al. 2014)]|uniref:Transcriptional regulator n=1 Tax=Commensalibacter papalotli (ex Servin-Garciduenas et al. 2014) TaxID=1208583 RepID=W7E4Y1_9PROT|nr:response regulator [Commensalibacter papalotli (ex Servin-Garciduenas et al. 2014)]EUK18126.1 transcriptional regulator [Commensalibacter papalotli (ex Servin-Garciduenas et al. 2014)]
MILSSASLLIIEDQPEICDLLELSLLNKVEKIYIAHSVTQACCLQSQFRFDIAIVDSCLPDGDPYPLVKELLTQQCKILLMSGNFELNKRLAQLPLPKIDKPFRLPTLIQSVEQAFQASTAEALKSAS